MRAEEEFLTVEQLARETGESIDTVEMIVHRMLLVRIAECTLDGRRFRIRPGRIRPDATRARGWQTLEELAPGMTREQAEERIALAVETGVFQAMYDPARGPVYRAGALWAMFGDGG